MFAPLCLLDDVLYSILVTTNIDDDGMNSLEVDDSEEGVRRRFTLWVAAIAFALGITLAGGISEVGEALSMPEYTKDFNNDGVVDFQDFLKFVDGFKRGDTRYDLDQDGQTGFSDFLAFARAFGRCSS